MVGGWWPVAVGSCTCPRAAPSRMQPEVANVRACRGDGDGGRAKAEPRERAAQQVRRNVGLREGDAHGGLL